MASPARRTPTGHPSVSATSRFASSTPALTPIPASTSATSCASSARASVCDLHEHRLGALTTQRTQPTRASDQHDRRSRRHVGDQRLEQIACRGDAHEVHIVEDQEERLGTALERTPQGRSEFGRELVRTGTTGDETIAVEIGHRVQCRHEVGQEDTGVAVPILEIDPRRRAFVPTQQNGCVRRLAVAGRCRDHSDTHGRRGEPAENVGARHHPHGWIGWGERRALRGPRGLLAHEPETRCRRWPASRVDQPTA